MHSRERRIWLGGRGSTFTTLVTTTRAEEQDRPLLAHPPLDPKALTLALSALPVVARLAGALVGGERVLTQGIGVAVV